MEEGRVISGKYRVGRELGSGGMGCVHEAMHLALGERVALKFLRPQQAAFPELTTRFLREAKSLFRIDSDHVVRMIDVDQDESGAPYLVMQLAEGEPLDAVLARRGALDVTHAAEVIAQICDGLGEAHRIGIVHRDVKPSNVMLTRASSGRLCAKLLDFGIAQGVERESGTRLTAAQAVIGTLSYMAPEQLRAACETDPRSDVWSVGIMLFELLTGRLPWRSTAPGDLVLRQHTEGVPTNLFGPHVPRELVEITLRCLALNRDERFFDAHEVADALLPWRAELGAYSLLVRPEEDDAPTEQIRRSDSGRLALTGPRASQTAPPVSDDLDEALPITRVPLGVLVGTTVSSLVVALVVLLGAVLSRESRDVRAPSHPLERPPAVAKTVDVPPPEEIPTSSATSAPSSRPPSTKPTKKAPPAPRPSASSIYTDKW